MAPSTEDRAIIVVTSPMDVVDKAIILMDPTVSKGTVVDFTQGLLLPDMALIVSKDIVEVFTLGILLLDEDEEVALLLPTIDCNASDNNKPRNVSKIYLPRNM